MRGLTTAASVWSVAGIGLAAGGGLWFAAVLTTVIILVGVKPLEEAYRARIQSAVLTIDADHDAITLDGVPALLAVRGGQLKRISAWPAPEGRDRVTIHLVKMSEHDIRTALGRLKEAPGVHKVEVERKPRRDRGSTPAAPADTSM